MRKLRFWPRALRVARYRRLLDDKAHIDWARGLLER